MTANPARGEIALILDGAEHVLRPTWEAIVAIEEQTGKGIVQLAREALDGGLRTRELAIVATECIRAWGRATANGGAAQVNANRVGALLLTGDGGVAEAMKRVGAVLLNAATGGYTETGEAKAATETAIPAAA